MYSCLLVHRKFNCSEFAFAKISLDIIEVINSWVADSFFDGIYPLISLILVYQKILPTFIRWENQPERVKFDVFIWNLLFFFFFDEGPNKTMHCFMVGFILFSVAIKLFAQEHEPISFKFAFRRFPVNLAFVLFEGFTGRGIHEVLDNGWATGSLLTHQERSRRWASLIL